MSVIQAASFGSATEYTNVGICSPLAVHALHADGALGRVADGAVLGPGMVADCGKLREAAQQWSGRSRRSSGRFTSRLRAAQAASARLANVATCTRERSRCISSSCSGTVSRFARPSEANGDSLTRRRFVGSRIGTRRSLIPSRRTCRSALPTPCGGQAASGARVPKARRQHPLPPGAERLASLARHTFVAHPVGGCPPAWQNRTEASDSCAGSSAALRSSLVAHICFSVCILRPRRTFLGTADACFFHGLSPGFSAFGAFGPSRASLRCSRHVAHTPSQQK